MASVDTANAPAPGLPAALVAGTIPGTLREAMRALTSAGFRSRAVHVAASEPASSAIRDATELVILLVSERPATVAHAVRDIRERHSRIRIIVALPPDAANPVLRKVLRAGVAGLVAEDEIGVALGATALAVAAGQLVVPARLRDLLAPRPLSQREKQVLGLVVMGMTNRQIADRLYLAESTVKTHLSSAFSKLDAGSRSEATARILDPHEGYGPGILSMAGAEPASAG